MYSVSIDRDARKALARLPDAMYRRVVRVITALADDPRPHSCKKLVDRPGWRIRVGSYRVIYDINDDERTVVVVTVAPRGEVYR